MTPTAWSKYFFFATNLLGPVSLIIGFIYIHYDSVGRFVEPASRNGLGVLFRNIILIAYGVLALVPAFITLMVKPRMWLYLAVSVIPLATLSIVLGSFVSVWIYGR